MLGNSYLFYTEEELIFRIWYSYTTLRGFNTLQTLVILGLDPSIHRRLFDMDSRNKSENDGEWSIPFRLNFFQKVAKTACKSFKTL